MMINKVYSKEKEGQDYEYRKTGIFTIINAV